MNLRRLLFCCLFFALPLCAAPVGPAFQAGERWCAVGDSITHGGLYHRYIQLFYETRFPSRSIEFFNCGISGDTAAGALKRIEGDILRHKPTVATVMLGMNDVSRHLYEEGLISPDLQTRRNTAVATHSANMRKLAEKLQAAGTRLVFITPSIFDETAVMERPNLPGVNGALGLCAENTRNLAREFQGTVVDFHSAMSEINRQQQQINPAFTLIGADRIHPGELGHFVMAYLFLKTQDVPAMVADISIDAGGKDGVEFTRLEEALPFPVPTGACTTALKLVPFMEELNQERLRVNTLAPGEYKLFIDKELVATFSAEELAAGINLAAFPTTPQYRQALGVAKLDEQRHELVKRLRTVDYVERMMGREIGDPSEFDYTAAAQKLLDDPRHTGWPRDRVKEYLPIKMQQHVLQAQLEALKTEIHKVSQPHPHIFELRK